MKYRTAIAILNHYQNYNWFPGYWPGNRCKRGSASTEIIEAEPPDLRYQAEPGNE